MRSIRTGMLALLVAGSWLAVFPGEGLAQKKDRYKITRAEILESAQKDGDLLAVVRSLRPHFLARPRGVRSFGGGNQDAPVLYVNGNRMGELNGLKEITAASVEEVIYMEPSKAEDTYGVGHNGGVVAVKLITENTRAPVKPATPR